MSHKAKTSCHVSPTWGWLIPTNGPGDSDMYCLLARASGDSISDYKAAWRKLTGYAMPRGLADAIYRADALGDGPCMIEDHRGYAIRRLTPNNIDWLKWGAERLGLKLVVREHKSE